MLVRTQRVHFDSDGRDPFIDDDDSHYSKIAKGVAWSFSIALTLSGAVYPLTGYTAAMKVRKTPKSATALVSITGTVVGATGTVSFAQTAAQTTAYTFANAWYDAELYDSGGECVARLIEGKFITSDETTR